MRTKKIYGSDEKTWMCSSDFAVEIRLTNALFSNGISTIMVSSFVTLLMSANSRTITLLTLEM